MAVVSNEPGSLERRTAERIDAQFQIEFQEISESEADKMIQLLGLQELDLPDGARDLAHVPEGAMDGEKTGGVNATNVSATGLKISGDFHLLGSRAMDRGTRLMLELYMPLKHTPLVLLGAVAWQSGGEGKADMGLCFTAARPQDLEQIDGFVKIQSGEVGG